MWSALLHLWFLSCMQSLLRFWWWPAPTKCLDICFCIPHGRPDCSLYDLQPHGLPQIIIKCLLASQTLLLCPASSSDAVAGCIARSLTNMSLSSLQEGHGGSTVPRRRPTSAGTNHFPGPASFAVCDALRAVLREVPLRSIR
jgi:hypothetical protein